MKYIILVFALLHSVSARRDKDPAQFLLEGALLIIFLVFLQCLRMCCCGDNRTEQTTNNYSSVNAQSYRSNTNRTDEIRIDLVTDYPRQSQHVTVQQQRPRQQMTQPSTAPRYVPLHPENEQPERQWLDALRHQQPVQPLPTRNVPYPLDDDQSLMPRPDSTVGWRSGAIDIVPTAPPMQTTVPLTPPPRYEDICPDRP